MNCSPPGSSVHGISLARILEWVAISFSRDLSDPGIKLACLISPALAGGFFATSATWEAPLLNMHGCLVASVCPTLYDPIDCSPPDSSVLGILQARTLEWVFMLSSKGSSWPRDRIRVSLAQQADSLSLSHLGSSSFKHEWIQIQALLVHAYLT